MTYKATMYEDGKTRADEEQAGAVAIMLLLAALGCVGTVAWLVVR